MATMYRVVATQPTAGSGGSLDSREVGPFSSRARAEDAAARLADDPRRWARVRVVVAVLADDEDEPDDDE